MRVVDPNSRYVNFVAEDGSSLEIGYDNRGEPYRDGLTLYLNTTAAGCRHVFIERDEVKKLKDLIEKLFPEKKS